MIVSSTATASVPPRRALCPVVTPDGAIPTVQGDPVPPSIDGEEILIRQGDIIDVGIIWAAWLAANDGKLKSSTWAADPASPDAPVLGTSGIDTNTGTTITLVDASAAAVGAVYVLANTVVIEDGTPSGGGYTLPDRTLKRIVHVRVTL